MKIVFTVADLQPESGGPSRSVPALAAALAGIGVEAQLFAQEYDGANARPVLPPESVRTTLVPCRGSLAKKAKWTAAFGAAIRSACVETAKQSSQIVLHDAGIWLPSNHAVARISRQLKVPRIVSPRGMLSGWAMGHKGWKKKVAWRLYQQHDLQTAQALHATSQAEAEEFRALGLRPPIAIIPNGVEMPPAAPQSATCRDEASSAVEDDNRHLAVAKPPAQPGSAIKTILFLSRIAPKKGLPNLVKAWAMLKADKTGHFQSAIAAWRIIVAGGDEDGHLEAVRAEARKLNVEKDFEFFGPVEGIAKWDLYRQADLFVLPSHSENFGLVIAEALVCGVPVITTRGTPWNDLVAHRCGWWVEIGAEPLAEALREAMNLPDADRREIGKRGQTLVEQKYSWPSVAGQMKAVYEWVLGAGPQPNWIHRD